MMPPRQPVRHREDWKSSGSRTELTNLPWITASVLSLSLSLSAYPPRRRLLSRLRTSVEMSLIFPVIEEAVMTVMLEDKPGPPTPPSPNSTKETYLSRYLHRALPEQFWLAGGWSDAGSPSQLSRLPSDIKHGSSPLFQPMPHDRGRRWCRSCLLHIPATTVRTR